MKIPFTTEQFFQIIEKYNLAVFPAQLIIIILGVLTLVFLHSKKPELQSLIGGFIAILWIWTGIVYHLMFFTAINKPAYFFGAIFIIQGLLLLYETFVSKKLQFSFKGQTIDYVAYFFIIFGLAIYPVLIYFPEKDINTTITLGLPCPTTILTFGFLMLTKTKFPKYLLIIPAIWTVIGTTAAFNFGVYPDYMIMISALVAIIYLLTRKKTLFTSVSSK